MNGLKSHHGAYRMEAVRLTEPWSRGMQLRLVMAMTLRLTSYKSFFVTKYGSSANSTAEGKGSEGQKTDSTPVFLTERM